MKMTGYRGYSWEADGYRAGIPAGGIATGSVVPSVIYRTGTTPVFGVSQISEMSVPVEFVYQGSKSYEQAWIDLMKRLRPLDTIPAYLLGQLNDGINVRTWALLTIPAQASSEINVLGSRST